MGHLNQLYFLAQHVEREAPRRVIEIGSRNYGNTVAWRKAFPQAEYVGVDMSAGDGVDVVCDLERGTDGIDGQADLVICCSVLEHTRRPWRVAEHIAALVAPGGRLYVSVPWVWRYHPYPDDYWRFSPSAVRELFPGFTWKAQTFSTYVEGDFYPAIEGMDDELARVDGDGAKWLPYMEVHSLGIR